MSDDKCKKVWWWKMQRPSTSSLVDICSDLMGKSFWTTLYSRLNLGLLCIYIDLLYKEHLQGRYLGLLEEGSWSPPCLPPPSPMSVLSPSRNFVVPLRFGQSYSYTHSLSWHQNLLHMENISKLFLFNFNMKLFVRVDFPSSNSLCIYLWCRGKLP